MGGQTVKGEALLFGLHGIGHFVEMVFVRGLCSPEGNNARRSNRLGCAIPGSENGDVELIQLQEPRAVHPNMASRERRYFDGLDLVTRLSE